MQNNILTAVTKIASKNDQGGNEEKRENGPQIIECILAQTVTQNFTKLCCPDVRSEWSQLFLNKDPIHLISLSAFCLLFVESTPLGVL